MKKSGDSGAIPSDYFKPSGTLPITSNGTYDVKNYASASVNIPGITPTGTLSISENGTYDVTNYAGADVNVAGSSSNFVHGEFTTQTTEGVQTISIPYSGNGWPLVVYICIKGGAYNQGTDWYNLVQPHAVGVWSMSKSKFGASPDYSTTVLDPINYGVTSAIYKSSSTSPSKFAASVKTDNRAYINYDASKSDSPYVVRIKSSNTISVYVGNSEYGLAYDQDYEYFIAYSS